MKRTTSQGFFFLKVRDVFDERRKRTGAREFFSVLFKLFAMPQAFAFFDRRLFMRLGERGALKAAINLCIKNLVVLFESCVAAVVFSSSQTGLFLLFTKLFGIS
jgi:D-alanyl-lipoteichoic acid acyltransferase DltB (MBOAT superfamily)